VEQEGSTLAKLHQARGLDSFFSSPAKMKKPKRKLLARVGLRDKFHSLPPSALPLNGHVDNCASDTAVRLSSACVQMCMQAEHEEVLELNPCRKESLHAHSQSPH
jgi:L-lactate utilization protein LutC